MEGRWKSLLHRASWIAPHEHVRLCAGFFFFFYVSGLILRRGDASDQPHVWDARPKARASSEDAATFAAPVHGRAAHAIWPRTVDRLGHRPRQCIHCGTVETC